METINIDKNHFDCCSIDANAHIENSLGEPITLPPSIQETLEEANFCLEFEEDLLSLFGLMKGCEYERVVRENTYNSENDLDQYFVYSVFAPAGSYDWIWQSDCFVVVEIGSGGDPRYAGYGPARIYDLGDCQLGDSGFFDWTLGWYARYFAHGEPNNETDSAIEDVNNETSAGWSSYPTSHLRDLCYADPIWVETLEGYVARVKGAKHPMVFYPTEPCYC